MDGSSTLTEFDAASNNLNATDYRVRVEVADGSSGYINSSEVGTFEQVAGGGVSDSKLSLGMGAPILALVLVGSAGYLRSRD